MNITNNCIVELAYKLTFVGDDEPVEVFSERNPLEILVGMGEMLPAFESQLLGKRVGDRLEFVIDKKDAFGDFDDELVKAFPKAIFNDKQGQFDERSVYEGAIITLETDEEESQDAFVIEIYDDEVLLDFNHPMAGEDLHYEIMILSVRLPE